MITPHDPKKIAGLVVFVSLSVLKSWSVSGPIYRMPRSAKDRGSPRGASGEV